MFRPILFLRKNALLRIAVLSVILSSSLNAIDAEDVELYLDTGAPVDGTVEKIDGEDIYIKTPSGELNTCRFDEFSKYSRKQIMVWAFEQIASNTNLFFINSTEVATPSSTSSVVVYDCQIHNNSPVALPGDITVTYNSHVITFNPEPIPDISGLYEYTHRTATTGSLVDFEGLVAKGLFEFEAKSLGRVSQSQQTEFEERYTPEELNPELDILLGKSFRLDGKDKLEDGVPRIERSVLEIRVLYEGELLYRYVDQPEFEDLISSSWKLPTLTANDARIRMMMERQRLSRVGRISESEHVLEAAAPTEPEPSEAPVPPVPYETIVLINSDSGTATGCLVKMKGRTFMATNIHVIAGVESVTCNTVDGQRVNLPRYFFIAKDRDIAIFPIDHQGAFLEVEEDVSNVVRIDDKMTVFGNEGGASVVTECTGTVKGIGPARIETDAKFIEGNSGSPALHHATGKIIGIASYYIEYEVPEADRGGSDSEEGRRSASRSSRASEEAEKDKVRRRFAERLDNVEEWEKCSFESLGKEEEALKQYTKSIQGVVDIALTISQEQRVINPEEGSDIVQRALDEFQSKYSNTRSKGDGVNERALTRLKQTLISMLNMRYRNAEKRTHTAYYKRELERAHSHAEKVKEYMETVYSY